MRYAVAATYDSRPRAQYVFSTRAFVRIWRILRNQELRSLFQYRAVLRIPPSPPSLLFVFNSARLIHSLVSLVGHSVRAVRMRRRCIPLVCP